LKFLHKTHTIQHEKLIYVSQIIFIQYITISKRMFVIYEIDRKKNENTNTLYNTTFEISERKKRKNQRRKNTIKKAFLFGMLNIIHQFSFFFNYYHYYYFVFY
jgi:Pyruvate/2-oxoacid:ferredoxin oxidoreductase gamma subunit